VRGRRNIGWCWQNKVQDKSNEITAIIRLELLDVKGCIVTLMPWAPKTIAAQDSAGASRLYPLLEKPIIPHCSADRHLV